MHALISTFVSGWCPYVRSCRQGNSTDIGAATHKLFVGPKEIHSIPLNLKVYENGDLNGDEAVACNKVIEPEVETCKSNSIGKIDERTTVDGVARESVAKKNIRNPTSIIGYDGDEGKGKGRKRQCGKFLTPMMTFSSL